MKPHQPKTCKNRGISLIEVLVVIAIIGIIAAFAIPSYQDMIERNRLKQAAESLADDLKFARAEAIKRSIDTTLTLTAGWSYTVTSGGDTLKTVQGSQFTGISLDSADSVTFSFRRGTPDSPLRRTLSSTRYQAAVDVCQSGKIVVCTPDGATGLLGYPTCPTTAGDCQ